MTSPPRAHFSHVGVSVHARDAMVAIHTEMAAEGIEKCWGAR